MEKNPYLLPRKIELGDFENEVFFLTAEQAHEEILVHFVEHVNEVECPFRKRFYKMVEATQRIKSDKDLNLDFDKEKSENAAIHEMYLKPNSKQNADFSIYCDGLRRFFKAQSNKAEPKSLERMVFKKISELTEMFYASIEDDNPEQFNKQTVTWLTELNRLKRDMQVAMPA